MICTVGLLSVIENSAAQNSDYGTDNKTIDFGIKAGFNSTMLIVSDFQINNVRIEELQNNYKLGYFGTMFLRINMKKHYLQPEISYNVSKGEITFDKLGSQHPAIEPDYASIQSTLHSIDIPLLYGYNLVKQAPYSMSIFGGPKLRYIWEKKNQITFENFDQKGINEQLYPISASVVAGISVSISNVFFDFRYEQGIHNISKSITYDNINIDNSTGQSQITLKRREQVLSFSLGIIF